MIPKECKRLAEVDFPIAVVSKHAAREKSIRHGHPSTLHLWWARRPLAACRAMLLGLLLPDPCDLHCPTDFKEAARNALQELLGVREGDEGLRRALITFIGDVANWDVANHPRWIGVARALVKAAHGNEPPLVVDPFAGGGSIPLEALRLGCDAFASDLNPVACLILKVLLEDIPRHRFGLAEELRRVGAEIKAAAEKELSPFYPPDPDGANPIAYLWARTVRCETPNCGAEIPLLRSFWLCKKTNRRRALRPSIVHSREGTPRVEFEIFEPKTESEVPSANVSRAKATCLCCRTVMPPDRVRTQLAAQSGGAEVTFDETGKRIGGTRLLAVVTLKHDEQGRHYRLPMERDYEAVYNAKQCLRELATVTWPGDLNPVPDEPLPPVGTLGFRVQRYGVLQWGDLFTARQKLALTTLSEKVRNLTGKTEKETMALLLSKFIELSTANCPWEPVAECPRKIFNMQAIPTRWEFAEGVITSSASGGIAVVIDNFLATLHAIGSEWTVSQPSLADATASPLPIESADIWFTDPPYYDAVPYADLSDFFFVWLKRLLPGDTLLRDPFDPSNPLTPKVGEIVQDEVRRVDGGVKDRDFFEYTIARAFAEGQRILREDGVGCVIFAHKTTEGWEALLSGMLSAKWVITASWPITTEQRHRPRARESAALVASVHLICRPRAEDAQVGDWGDVLHELPIRVGNWIERLQDEGVRGADLVFACIGPALEIFSRYSKVETAEGREVRLPEFLEKIWEVVGRTALEEILGTAEATARNSAVGALEEDARLTALFLWTLQSTNIEVTNNGGDGEEDASEEDDDEETTSPSGQKGFSLIFDVVRRFSQPLGIHLDQWDARIIETKKGVVRLLAVTERAQHLFGTEGAQAVADHLERNPQGAMQLKLFSEGAEGAIRDLRGGRRRRKKQSAGVSDDAFTAQHEATTLDRVHMAMLFQASGRTNALRALLTAEQDRGPEFLRLANALSALYPSTSEEKRLLDAMLLAIPKK